MEWVYRLQDIDATALEVAQAVSQDRCLAFHGSMGAGKTTFIHHLCRIWGVQDAIASPTFSLVNEYESPDGKIYHIDLYRIADAQEAFQAGIQDCLESEARCLVEWPERAEQILPPGTRHLHFRVVDETTRVLHLR